MGIQKLSCLSISDVTLVDLVELELVKFDVILDIDLFHPCYALVDCRIRIIRFQFLDEPILEWNGSSLAPVDQFISYLKDRMMISKGYLYHLVWVKDSSSETLTFDSVPIVFEFQKVYSKDLPEVPLEREINFGKLILIQIPNLVLFLLKEWLRKSLKN